MKCGYVIIFTSDSFMLGGFYSDDVGHVAPSCKKCPNGSFVHFEEAPGTRAQDCKSCPRGNRKVFYSEPKTIKQEVANQTRILDVPVFGVL